MWCVMKFLILFSCVFKYLQSTIDINLAEYQYLADHLTEKECYELVAALHFHSFEFPKDINAAERRIPEGVPCIDLLLHWNSSPREGKGQTHVEVCHRLNQIGREDLAQWLSKTVFHEISKDLKNGLTAATETSLGPHTTAEEIPTGKPLDEAAWTKIDSFLEILIVFGLVAILFGAIFLCVLCCTRPKKSQLE